jgi:hypothetical protein
MIHQIIPTPNISRAIIAALSLLFITGLFSCADLETQIIDNAIGRVTKNDCGILVFRDSTDYQLIYNHLEKKQEDFENSPDIATAVDEEQPLTEFEIGKNFFSYRRQILSLEDAAENNGTDLSENPVSEILDDDDILQTFLTPNRLVIIDSTVYYYFDDCTLYKFPVGRDCKKSIAKAMAYFRNGTGKPPFIYQKIDICNDDENFSSLKSGCQVVDVKACALDPCNPENISLIFYMPGYEYTGYQFASLSYSTNNGGPSGVFSSFNAGGIDDPCTGEAHSYGSIQQVIFPQANNSVTYTVTINATFQYYTSDGGPYLCATDVVKEITITPCPFTEKISVNGLEVTVSVNNICNPEQDNYIFDPQIYGTSPNAQPTISNPATNEAILLYTCQGEKKVTIKANNQDGCIYSKEISVYPIDPSFCCTNDTNKRRNCKTTHINSSGTNKIITKLKERNKKLVAIVRHFKKVGNKFKRDRTTFNGKIAGPVVYYRDGCDCYGEFSFSKSKTTKRKKVRIKYKFKKDKDIIENQTGKDFEWFLKHWARKGNTPWRFEVTTSTMPQTMTAKINCSNTGGECNQ